MGTELVRQEEAGALVAPLPLLTADSDEASTSERGARVFVGDRVSVWVPYRYQYRDALLTVLPLTAVARGGGGLAEALADEQQEQSGANGKRSAVNSVVQAALQELGFRAKAASLCPEFGVTFCEDTEATRVPGPLLFRKMWGFGGTPDDCVLCQFGGTRIATSILAFANSALRLLELRLEEVSRMVTAVAADWATMQFSLGPIESD